MALTDDLVSYWKLDESSGNAADSIGSNTLTNTNVTFGTGKINNGAVFNGSSANLKKANLTIGANFSLGAWIYTTAKDDYDFIWMLEVSGGNNLTGRFDTAASNNMRMQGWTGATTVITTTTGNITNDAWHYVMWTRSGTTGNIYVDGVLAGTGTTNNLTAFTNGLVFGSNWAANASWYTGTMDEIGYWDRTLSADEVSQLYNSNRALAYPLTAPTLYGGISYYKLDESSGNATDSIGSYTLTNNGTMPYDSAKINNGADCSSTDYLSATHIDPDNYNAGLSYSFWIKFDTLGTVTRDVFYWNEASSWSGTFVRVISATDVRFRFGTGENLVGGETAYNPNFSTGTWYHIAATHTPTANRYYINGTEVATKTTGTINLAGNSTGLTIGQNNTSGTNPLDGLIDEIGIWGRALTATEVSTLYNSGSGNQYPFSTAYSLVCARGQFTLTGISNTITKALKSIMSAGSFTLTGINASFSRGKKLICDVGEFVLTGSDTLLKRAYTLVASAGEFTLIGINVIILKALKMIAATGVYALTFKDFIIKGWDIITNIARPSSSMINSSKVIGGETWDTNTNTWDEETRTWDASGTLWTNGTRPTTTITNITKG
jgi:hypothetical protein